MDKEKLIESGIDYENAVRRFAGKKELYEKYLAQFAEDDHMAKAMEALKKKDYQDLLEQVHTLKGVVGTLGMTALFQACSKVVDAIRADKTSNMEELMERAEKEYEKMLAVLQS